LSDCEISRKSEILARQPRFMGQKWPIKQTKRTHSAAETPAAKTLLAAIN